MTYATIQTAVATLIKNVSGYSADNVSEGDYRMFAKGLRKGVVLMRGNSTSSRAGVTASGFTIFNRWGINIELWAPYKSNVKTVRDTLNTEINAISAELNKWPQLNGTAGVIHHDTGAAPEAEEFTITGAQGRWFRQVIPFEVLEEESVTVSE